MKKYQLRSLRPVVEGFVYPDPTQQEVKRRLDEAGHTDTGIDKHIGLYVVCEKKPEDFPEIGLWWVDVDEYVIK